MITAYLRQKDKVVGQSVADGKTLPSDALWIDLLNPDDATRLAVSKALNLDLPTFASMHAIESSSRLYSNGTATFLTLNVLVGSETPEPELDSLLIAFTPERLVTLRASEPRSIAAFAERIHQQPDLFATTHDGVLALLDTIADRIADTLETLGRSTNQISKQIFRHPHGGEKEKRLQDILQGIGRIGEMTHKIRDSIGGLTRMTTFLEPRLQSVLNKEQAAKFQTLQRDIASLAENAQFVAQETSFMLDATLGLLNVEQNNIIKVMSIVMVALTPPTFFASLWGMNFHDMPEYAWSWGYPMAIVVMLISGILPLIYFRRRGWM